MEIRTKKGIHSLKSEVPTVVKELNSHFVGHAHQQNDYLRTVDFVYLQYCPDDDCSIAVKTVGIKCSLLKDNVWLVYQESLLVKIFIC